MDLSRRYVAVFFSLALLLCIAFVGEHVAITAPPSFNTIPNRNSDQNAISDELFREQDLELEQKYASDLGSGNFTNAAQTSEALLKHRLSRFDDTDVAVMLAREAVIYSTRLRELDPNAASELLKHEMPSVTTAARRHGINGALEISSRAERCPPQLRCRH